jgi:hypothetical protein
MRGEVTARARELAGRLSVLFESAVELVRRVNDAAHRLRCANDGLWSGFHPEAVGVACEDGGRLMAGPSTSSIARQLIAGRGSGGERPDVDMTLVEALEHTHWAIHHAFCDYQSACEQRRQLAVDVGELSDQLIAELASAGWREQAARGADVHELAGATATSSVGDRR